MGETGGKDFVLVHKSAQVDVAVTALIRGAFEYQGQKCSAASRAYLPKSLWPAIKEGVIRDLAEIKVGPVEDFENFVNAVIEPTVIVTQDPHYVTMCEELFGPVLTVYVYEDEDFEKILPIIDSTSIYALTGCIISQDRYAIAQASHTLRNAAGNFYVNDKPTGAVVGQQPFGGARGSGTNDKAGSMINLLRWVSPRTIKETFDPPKSYRYPFLDKEL